MSYLHVSKQPTGTGECHNNQHDREWVWISSLIRFVLESGNPECSESSLKEVFCMFCFDNDAPWANFKPCLGTEITLEAPALCRHSPVIIIVCWWYPHIVFAFVRWFCVPNLKEKTWNEPSESPKPSFTRFVCRGYGQLRPFFPQLGGEITMVLVIPTPNHRRNA